MNIAKRVKEIRVEPLAGDELEQLKEAVKELSILFNCKTTFNHNGSEYVCDSEGGIAKIN
jgi:hypothetical protein